MKNQLVKTGGRWRVLPKDFAPWPAVYSYFKKWEDNVTFEGILDILS